MSAPPPAARPSTAFGFGLAGSILIVVGSLFFLALGFGFLGAFALIGLFAGTFALAGSILLYTRPQQHVVWGVVVLVASTVSIVGLGGFVLGMVLGIIGGALGISWKPDVWGGTGGPYMGPYGVPVMPWRMCMGCGRWIPWAYNVCPLCGTQAPVAAWAPRPDAGPGPATAPAPAFAPPAAQAPCPTCDGQAEWLPQHQKWYCPNERRYF